jgi:hypothetical protein
MPWVGSSSSISLGSIASVVAISSARLRAVAQFHRSELGVLFQIYLAQQLQSTVVERIKRSVGTPELETAAELALQRHPHVLQHREVAKTGRDLDRPDHAAAGDVGRRLCGDVLALEQDLAAVGVRNLVSRLKQVVLPAPLGPISAWMPPR